MPNTFGNSPLLDPSKLLQECLDRGLPTYWHGECTVARCPPGREPGTAAFLMRYGDVRQLDRTTDHTLNLYDGTRSLDLVKWTIREAFAPISGAVSMSDDTSYLVRAVDRRHHLRRSPFSQAYNVTTDGSTYVAATTNAGTPWTWQGMFGSLWAKLPPGASSAPTLPFTPHGTPQNFTWFGHPSAWDALNDLLDRLACILCYNPVTDTFTVERLGIADAAAEAFETKAKRDGNLTFDTLPVAFERADKPESVRVVFRRYPAPSAGSDPTYAVTTSLGGTGVVAGTVVQIEDDLCAIGATGTPTNSSTLATRAAERVDDFKRKLAGFDRRLVRSYLGLWKDAVAVPGSTYAGLAFEDRGQAYRTEVQAKPDARIEAWKAERPGGASVPVLASGVSSWTNSYAATTAYARAIQFTTGVPAGTYFVTAVVQGTVTISSSSPAFSECRLQAYLTLTTAPGTISKPQLIVKSRLPGEVVTQTVTLTWIVTVNAGELFELWARYAIDSGTIMGTAVLNQSFPSAVYFTWQQLS